MMQRWCLLLLLCLAGLTCPAYSQAHPAETKKPIADVHKDKGLACTDCHGEGQKKPVSKAKCQECHGSYKELAEATKNLEPNPHYNHTIDLDCKNCHLGHKPMQIYCQNCHKTLEFVPKPGQKKEEK